MAALGSDGVEAAKDLIDKELRHAAATTGPAAKPSSLDDRIADLRKTLKTLRDDPALSHDQLEKVGLPALDQLTTVYRQPSVQNATRNVKVGHAAAQLQQLIAVLKVLDAEWKDNPPLPVHEYIQKAEQQLGQFTTPEEEEARKVYQQNAALEPKLDRNLVSGMQAVNTMARDVRPASAGLRSEALRGRPRTQRRHAIGELLRPRIPRPRQKDPLGPGQAGGHDRLGREYLHGSNASIEAIKAWFLSPGHHRTCSTTDNAARGWAARASTGPRCSAPK